MNRIVLVGRLVKDPEKKVIDENESVVTRFTIAVDRPYKNSEGEKEADFIPVVFWGRRAEILHEFLKKGRMISITGRLQTRSYTDSEGNKKYISEVRGDEFQFIDNRFKKVE